MAAEEFKLGDVVRLKSGGPKMTVRAVLEKHLHGPIVVCDWFVQDTATWKSKNAIFHLDELIKVEPLSAMPSTQPA